MHAYDGNASRADRYLGVGILRADYTTTVLCDQVF